MKKMLVTLNAVVLGMWMLAAFVIMLQGAHADAQVRQYEKAAADAREAQAAYSRQLSGIELALDQEQQPIQLQAAMQRVGIQTPAHSTAGGLARLTTEVVGGER